MGIISSSLHRLPLQTCSCFWTNGRCTTGTLRLATCLLEQPNQPGKAYSWIMHELGANCRHFVMVWQGMINFRVNKLSCDLHTVSRPRWGWQFSSVAPFTANHCHGSSIQFHNLTGSLGSITDSSFSHSSMSSYHWCAFHAIHRAKNNFALACKNAIQNSRPSIRQDFNQL